MNKPDLWMQVVKKCFRDSLGQTCGFTGTCYAADRCPFCDRVSFELCPNAVSPVFLFSCWIFLLNYLNWSTFWFMAHGISRSFKFTELSRGTFFHGTTVQPCLWGNITMNRRGDFLEISDDDGQLKRVLRETGALFSPWFPFIGASKTTDLKPQTLG